MTGGYLRLVRTGGVPRLAVAFLALGIASTMTPVAFVLFARAATGSFASASLVLGALTAGGLVFAPARGRLVDRAGASRAVIAVALPDVLTDAGFIIAGQARVGAAALVLLGFISGAVTAPASVALRAVWSETLPEGQSKHVGYALLTVMQETTYIAGPLLAGGLIALWSATVAVAVMAVLSLVGALAFATTPTARAHAPAPKTPGRLRALSGSGMRTVLAGATLFGLTFGALDVTFPAFAHAHGSAAFAGVLLSGFAAGSLLGGLLYGLRPPNRTAGQLYPLLCLLAAAGLAPLILTPSLDVMLGLAALSGLCFAPITTSQIAVIDDVAQPEHKSEAFSWLGTLYGTGLALGAVLAGQLITAVSLRAAIAAACAATTATWIISTARASSLRTPHTEQQAPTTEPLAS